MKHLTKRPNKIITTADKGGPVVTMDTKIISNKLKIISNKLISNYLTKTITKLFKQSPLYNRIKW